MIEKNFHQLTLCSFAKAGIWFMKTWLDYDSSIRTVMFSLVYPFPT